MGITAERNVVSRDGADALARPILGWKCLRKRYRRERDHGDAQDEESEKDSAPLCYGHQCPTDGGGQDGRYAHDQHQSRKYNRRIVSGEEITNDCHRDHARRGGAETLKGSQRSEDFDGRSKEAGQRRADVNYCAHEQGTSTSVDVGQWADEQLAESQTQQGAGQGQLNHRVRRAEFLRDLRQRRKIHVDGERPEGGENSEKQYQSDPCTARRGDHRSFSCAVGQGNPKLHCSSRMVALPEDDATPCP
ncbi:hypothetical protein TSUKUMMB_51980 [Rhodococcus sp. no. 34]